MIAPRIHPRRIVALRRALLDWYRAHKLDYPWRRSSDSYRVWVAEVMLQQTRIAVVIPAYARFLHAFPSLGALAGADLESVLSAWSGLGYYTRARALHAAARVLVGRGASEFPRDYDEARRLPGVGPYTAAAVLSIAYGHTHAAVDGNIVRVLSRLQGLGAADARGEPYAGVAAQLLDQQHPGDWNQALMELGQNLCLPKTPLCGSCPLRRLCTAYRLGEVHRFPPRRRRLLRERVDVDLTILRDRAQSLLLERGAFPYLPHLWLPPTRRLAGATAVATLKHSILHRDFHVRVFAQTVSSRQLQQMARAETAVERRLCTPAQLLSIGRSSLLTKALAIAPPP